MTTPTKDLTQFLARFPEVLEERGEYGVPCPVHDDQRPSLFFRLKEDGRLLVRCWAGCDRDAILSALGMRPADLFDWTPGEGARTSAKPQPGDLDPGCLAALAQYEDTTNVAFLDPEHSEARDYVLRRFGLEPARAVDLGLGLDYPGLDARFPYRSTAYQRYPRLTVPLHDFSGRPRGLQGRDVTEQCPARWLSITSPEGAAWSKYGVFTAHSGFDTVLITEGPGDALTAVGVGYDAVAIRGAGLARNDALVEELAMGLQDRDVVLAGDRDTAGAQFTNALADALVRAGVMVRRLEIPHAGDDLTDWRARDPEAFPGQLHAAVRRAPLHVLDNAEPASSAPTAGEAGPLPLTDLGNAMRLYRQLGGHVRMVPGVGVYKWRGTHWQHVPKEALYADVRAVIQALEDEAGHDPEKRSRWALKSQESGRVKGMVEMLASIPGVYATVGRFDADPDLLAFRNAVVDLRTGQARPHDPADMNTAVLDVEYRPQAQAPRWQRFLEECHPHSPDMPAFLQMLTGYGITGYGVERCFVMHVGETTNGKTTFTETLEKVFSEITKRAEPSLFQKRRESGGPRADIVGLRGRRLVISSEWPANMPLDQALMKAVTGDQSITARGVYAREEITFRPVCLVQVDTNYAPDVDATDQALWQRVRVVPWLEDFRGRENKHLKATLAQEREGIAAWAVRGAMAWHREYQAGRGLAFPEAVERRTAHYRDTSHPLAGFIGEEFVVQEGAHVLKTETWDRYRTWAEESGIRHPMMRNRFYDALRTFPGVRESKAVGTRVMANLADCRALSRTPADGGSQDIFGQPRTT
ncbi:phage/plasmid primase, P4 family [Streptomyces noursei]|uniref:phage/plasmid primase, P4 family n=1 Tax=Streptomyces noursei TaxID=1971 RepID=UPI00081C59BE|nr:phage/plasmid primase, P4 family protein [Streptomyces noursei ATCC 11455]MCZ0996336.1 phage/plasmid primase, P4 family [Streptomyces noursei]